MNGMEFTPEGIQWARENVVDLSAIAINEMLDEIERLQGSRKGWEIDARRFSQNVDFWKNRFETAEGEVKRLLERVHSAEFWSHYVYPDGATPEQIQDELMDYHQILKETAKVYDHISGGRISKPNTMAFEVISIYDEKITAIEDRAEKAEDKVAEQQTALDAMQNDAAFHPRAAKLMRKKKNFIVIAEDEPYFIDAYLMIRAHEKVRGHWTDEDEKQYHMALLNASWDLSLKGGEE